MASRISLLRSHIKKATEAELRTTAIVTLRGLPFYAQRGGEGCVRAWGFTAGVNTTFQYPVPAPSPGGTLLLDAFMDDELEEANGEGVDWFGKTGATKERLALHVYPSIKEAPYWLKKKSSHPIEDYDGGLFAMLKAWATEPLTGEKDVILEWHFFQVNRVSFTGKPNELHGPQGSKMFLTFERD